MQRLPEVSALDLAALLCSKVCHDIISPVGAIANGLELLDEEPDAETSRVAMELIRASAANASAKLQFARIAFGAAGSAGAEIDTGDAEALARGYFANEKKTTLEWSGERVLMPKNKVKLLLNMVLVGLAAVPRGGAVRAEIRGATAAPHLAVTATGTAARVPPIFLDFLSGTFAGTLDAHAIQPLYTLKLAEAAGMAISATASGESVMIEAR
ncbi:MAG: histidine phosphotransferase [Alphaproteobacteria bacterium]|nr:MAG: histidine phosphotransferase [Alphaproteobacteria bacterium]